MYRRLWPMPAASAAVHLTLHEASANGTHSAITSRVQTRPNKECRA
jgi:hypothetical protein